MNNKLFILSAILLIGLFTIGCENETDEPDLNILSVTPKDGATGVAKTVAIQVDFTESMNTESCESRFGLHEGELTEMPMMGMMNGLDGSFHWNSDSTMMTFQPDSMLMDSTMYTICLMEGMQTADHDRTMMLSDMSDNGDQVDNGIFSKFFTQ